MVGSELISHFNSILKTKNPVITTIFVEERFSLIMKKMMIFKCDHDLGGVNDLKALATSIILTLIIHSLYLSFFVIYLLYILEFVNVLYIPFE